MGKTNSLLDDSMGSLTDMLNADTTSNGEPLRLALDILIPDPNQPRDEFNEVELQELADSVEEHGVIQPISVGPINDEGKRTIKHGERRWRASLLVDGVEDIPAFIDHSSDNYTQMIENIQREDLTPMEIGKWCLSRIGEGQEAKEIAKRLGKPDSFVSLHKELPKLSPVIMSLYTDKIVRSPRLLVDLKRASKIDAEATAKFCGRIQLKGGATKKEIDAFISGLKKAKVLGKDGGSDDDDDTKEPSGTKEPTPAKAKPAVGDVQVRLGNNEKTGVLMLDKASERESVWVNFDGSEALMDMSDLRIIGVKLPK